MGHRTVGYKLTKGTDVIIFNSQKEANEFLHLSKDAVGSAYRQHAKCRGYSVERLSPTSHGASKTRLFKAWDAMKQRCFNPNCKCYKNYGGRGVTVCDEWLKFENFRDWALKNGYSDLLTIDRINVNGNYEPSNCRWATMREQQNNKRNNRRIVIDGIEMTVAECSRKYGVLWSTVARRLETHGEAITESYRRRKPVKQLNDSNIVRVFESAYSAEKETGINSASICRCCAGKGQTAGGFRWEYANIKPKEIGK